MVIPVKVQEDFANVLVLFWLFVNIFVMGGAQCLKRQPADSQPLVV
jgi:hypothetical protein